MRTATEWLLTAPWDPIALRRGDPLGFRMLANRFADMVAPDLSNRTQDARWITLLAWCLCISEHSPWQKIGDIMDIRSVRTRDGARRRYEWLRPLELLWVTRACLVDPDTSGRQLPGVRAIKRWIERDDNDRYFGLTDDQWTRYRQTGVYGAYRVLFRRLPGLTKGGDGWTPDRYAHQLAELVVRSLGRQEQLPELVPEKPISAKAKPETYWRHAWKTWPGNGSSTAKRLLPQSANKIEPLANADERRCLEDLLFGETRLGQRRRRVAGILAKSDAVKHPDLCEELSNDIADELGGSGIELLPAFTRFADAAVDALVGIWACFFDTTSQGPAIHPSDLARDPTIVAHLEVATFEAENWCIARKKLDRAALVTGPADTLAQHLTAPDRHTATSQIITLVEHHMLCGGGLRWMAMQGKDVVPIAPVRYDNASRYRFRLWQLARLAVQCGAIPRVPTALDVEHEVDDEDHEQGVVEVAA